MRLFKRTKSCPKTELHTVTDESQKNWSVFRLFQTTGGSLLSKEPAAATVCLQDLSSRQPPELIDNSGEDSFAAIYKFSNQNYTSEVAQPTSSEPTVEALRDSHNSGGDAQGRQVSHHAKEPNSLQRYERWKQHQQGKPRFHFGPRPLSGDSEDTAGGVGGEGEGQVSASRSSSENIISLPTKFSFIYQDGKFVEREVNKWPMQKRQQPHLRYRVLEPYASQYGRRYRKRIATQELIVSQRHRLIYQNPIYKLPRKMMEENKSRLMIRHSLKNSFEESRTAGGPQKLDVGERAQAKMIKHRAEKTNQKNAEAMVNNYMAAAKGKTG